MVQPPDEECKQQLERGGVDHGRSLYHGPQLLRIPSIQSWDTFMKRYCSYHERSRTHLSLAKDTPIPRAVTPPGDGAVVAIPEVGGLHHPYERRAA
jgi:hypothetical protein